MLHEWRLDIMVKRPTEVLQPGYVITAEWYMYFVYKNAMVRVLEEFARLISCAETLNMLPDWKDRIGDAMTIAYTRALESV